jgi:transposase InsO family protein
MPFRERSILDEREEFCRLASAPEANVSELCRRFGVSRDRGYVWLGRYREAGREGLVERSRRPRSSPSRSRPETEAKVLAVRAEHPAWGGRKIERVLKNTGEAKPPAASTITEILRRHGKLDGPFAGEARAFARFEQSEPNELWQMDFKGHFPLSSGRCHPLTVLDDHSRYALALEACANEQTQTVQARLSRAFKRYGLPRRILCDNGSPWGTAGSCERHTLLSVWLMDLDVGVTHGRPFHPQTQGKDERFHRTLKLEVIKRTDLSDLDHAQRAFDAWRQIYNAHRPHQALDLDVPADRYAVSPRPLPNAIKPPEYASDACVRKVQKGGHISFKGRDISCSKAFVGKSIAFHATEIDGVFDLYFRRHHLSQVDLREMIVQS